LFLVGYSHVAGVERLLAKLEQDRGGWGVDGGPWHIELEVQQRLPHRVPRTIQLVQRHAIGGGHLPRIQLQLGCGGGPEHERRDQVPRPTEKVVEPTEDRLRRQRQTNFFANLAQRRIDGGFTRVQPAARQRPLAAVPPQRSRPAREHKARATNVVGDEHHPHRRGPRAFRLQRDDLMQRKVRRDPLAQLIRKQERRRQRSGSYPTLLRMQISLMLAVPDAGRASAWYQSALGATELWSLGGVRGLELEGAPFFLGEPANNGWESPNESHLPSCRVEVFTDDPEVLVARAVAAGANSRDPVREHRYAWGVHRQGGFVDPFGHIWLVGDTSPLKRYP